ncbi:MAG: UDP-N-acetylmuramoyl-L-alanine--D-glutamate ligase, partial [Actinomycetia bacterium]|nr:UDP-N-acetylmuramoyl-L-alanine--D-glutamate ligase [Actinomycetes bacterium]
MEFPFKNVVVIGLGISGLSVAKKLNSIGVNVLLTEVKEDNEKKRIAVELEKKGIKVVFGKHKEEFLNVCDLVIPSPGVSIMEPFFQKAKELRVPIWSEVELGYQFIKNKNPMIVGVTGTNGKTTTVTLIGEILKKAGKKVKIVGNIGYPFINAVDNAEDDSIFVVELSSFQLYFIKEFKPFISCILNVKEDHFDWHPTFHDYIQAKARILMNQTSNDYALFNFYDDISKKLSRKARARIVVIGENNPDYSAYIKDNFIMSNIGGKKKVIELEKIKLKGRHNIINLMFVLVTSQL